MGFKEPLTRDPLLWCVLAVAAGAAIYQGVRKDGAWALFDFVVTLWALGNLAAAISAGACGQRLRARRIARRKGREGYFRPHQAAVGAACR